MVLKFITANNYEMLLELYNVLRVFTIIVVDIFH